MTTARALLTLLIATLVLVQISMVSSASARLYPGTASRRMHFIRERVRALRPEELSDDWPSVRRLLLHVAGLRDIDDTARIGTGYTGHCFNDDSHCDATAMLLDVGDSLNEGQAHPSIARGNALGDGIRAASFAIGRNEDEEARDVGGTWCTCMNGCNAELPMDVAHRQFRSMIAFKLVWAPPFFDEFVLVDDDGALLNHGRPRGSVPHFRYRASNFEMVAGSKYAVEAEKRAELRIAAENAEARGGGAELRD